jgi:Protein of unknown function (DUF3866)
VIRLRRGIVTALGSARPGAHELEVDVDGRVAPAIAYPDLTGPISVGDAVIVNTTAVALGLGTGGLHLVVAVEGAEPGEETPGRTMKLRYTPMQTAVRGVEETHRTALEDAGDLRRLPVVCAPLHSMIAPVAAGAKRSGRDVRVVYVMTDGAALAGPFSRLVTELRLAGLLDGWVTCGQAFGGDLEAVTIWSGLLASRVVLDADVAIVADGPGNLGSETTWGVSALASGEALNAVRTLGGRPIPALRISFADPRARHHGLSHHSRTILRDVCLVETDVPVPVLEDAEQRAVVWDGLRGASLEDRHQLVEVDGRPALEELAARDVEVRSMGRGVADDPAFFLAAGAAGVLAGRLAAGDRRWR